MASYRALTDVLLGVDPGVAKAGEPIPDHYVDSVGNTQPVDFERLLELGAAELDDGKPPPDEPPTPPEGSYAELKKDELVKLAEERQLEVPKRAKVEQLVELLEAADATPPDEPPTPPEG